MKDVRCGFVIYGLCYVELVSLYAHFLENFFYHIWLLNSVFPACMRLIILFLFFSFLHVLG